jgi:hypothetical protein
LEDIDMGTRTGAVIAIAVVAALAGALVVRQGAVLGQQRDAEQAQLQVQEAQLLDKIRKLEAEKLDLEERARKNLAEARALTQQSQRVDKEKPKSATDFKPDVPRPTSQAAKLPRYEYMVFTIPDQDEEANAWLAKMSDIGWDYVGVIQAQTGLAMQNGVQVHQGARLMFKRVKK